MDEHNPDGGFTVSNNFYPLPSIDPSRYALGSTNCGVGSAVTLPCPECKGDPRGVMLLDKWHPCKTCKSSAP